MKDQFVKSPQLDLVALNDNTPNPVLSSRKRRSLRVIASTEHSSPEVHICLQLMRKCAGELLQFSGPGHSIMVSEHEASSKQGQIAEQARSAALQMLIHTSSTPGLLPRNLTIMVLRESAHSMCGPGLRKIEIPGSSRLTTRLKEEISKRASQHVLELLAARNDFCPRVF